jgi:hypothetical protein
MELDHEFVMCTAEAPEADALLRLGLVEGPANRHPGQGTACRRFIFENAYLELLWVDDESSATQPDVRRLQLWERWAQRDTGACPIGIALRPGADGEPQPPFPTWSYRPAYLAPGFSIEIALDSTLDQPLIFCVGFQRERTRQPVDFERNTRPFQRMTAATMGLPRVDGRSAACRAVEATGLVTIERADEYFVRLTFDDRALGMGADLRPVLPLGLRW